VWLFDLQVKELVWLSCAFNGCFVGENHDGSLWILNGYGCYRSVFLVEGFTLCIIVGCFLTVMRETVSNRIQIAIWLLCFSRVMVMGLFTWSWDYSHGIGIKVSQNLVLGWTLCQYICLWLLGDVSYASGYAFPLALLSNDLALKKLTEVIPLCVLGNCHFPNGHSLLL
jgi:hypothetical protein